MCGYQCIEEFWKKVSKFQFYGRKITYKWVTWRIWRVWRLDSLISIRSKFCRASLNYEREFEQNPPSDSPKGTFNTFFDYLKALLPVTFCSTYFKKRSHFMSGLINFLCQLLTPKHNRQLLYANRYSERSGQEIKILCMCWNAKWPRLTQPCSNEN